MRKNPSLQLLGCTIILGVMILLGGVFPFVSAVDISSCTNINAAGTYNIVADFSPNATDCINITASNVILNGNYHVLKNDTFTARVILIFTKTQDSQNITISNLNISMKEANVANSANIRALATFNITLNNITSGGNLFGYLFESTSNIVTTNLSYYGGNTATPIFALSDVGISMNDTRIITTKAGDALFVNAVSNITFNNFFISNTNQRAFNFNGNTRLFTNNFTAITATTSRVDSADTHNFTNSNFTSILAGNFGIGVGNTPNRVEFINGGVSPGIDCDSMIFLTNVSVNISGTDISSNCIIEKMDFTSFFANTTAGIPIPNRNINLYNFSGDLQKTIATNSLGFTNLTRLIEYSIIGATAVNTNYTPYYGIIGTTASQSFNFTSDIFNYNLIFPILLINSVSYSSQAYSKDVKTFTINISIPDIYTGANVFLTYNNTNYSMSTSDIGATKFFSTSIVVPTVQVATNVSFYYLIGLSNSSGTFYTTSDTFNQTVYPFLVDNCTTYAHRLFNFTMVDEENLNPINGTIELLMNFYPPDLSAIVATVNLSINYTSRGNIGVCFSDLNTTYAVSYNIRHYGDPSIYYKKFRNIQYMLVTNSTPTQQITLYNLLIASGFSFQIIVTGSPTFSNANLLVDVQRQYPALNNFFTVESPVTDTEGTTTGHFVPSSVVYNFVVSSFGQVLGTFQNYQVICENPATAQCSITLNLAQVTSQPKPWQNVGGISYEYTFSNLTSILTLAFNSLDGNVHNVTIRVYKYDNFGNTSICTVTSIGTSGTLPCAVPTNVKNFYSQLYSDGTYVATDFFASGANPSYYGVDIVIELLMYSSLVLLFMANPVTIVIGAIVGMFFAILLLFLTAGSMSALIAASLYFLAAGVIVSYLLGRRL